MPQRFDIFGGFKAGQELQQGQNTFAEAVKGLTERAKKYSELAAEQSFKLQGDIALEREKGRIAEERGSRVAEQMHGLLGGEEGGRLPVGSTISYNTGTGDMSYNIQANPNLTQEESTIVTMAPEIRAETDAIKQLLPKVGLTGRVGAKLPFLASGAIGKVAGAAPTDVGEVQELRTRIQRLESTIPFTFGGKQLTIQERQIIGRLLETVGKDDALIQQDMERFARIFEGMSNAIRNGTIGANDDIAKAQLTRQLLAKEGLGVPGITGTPPANNPVGEASRPEQAGDLRDMALQELNRRRSRR